MSKVWRFLKKLEIELPYDPAIPLLGIHTEETGIDEGMCLLCSPEAWLLLFFPQVLRPSLSCYLLFIIALVLFIVKKYFPIDVFINNGGKV